MQNYPMSGKFFRRMIVWIGLAIVLVTVSLSMLVMNQSQAILLSKEREANSSLFEQARININMMDEMAASVCQSLFLSGDVKTVMYRAQEDQLDDTLRINRIVSSTISSNPYIHSMTIYNKTRNVFINAGQSLFSDDVLLKEVVDGHKNVKKLRPVSRTLTKVVNDKPQPVQVFSYFLFDAVGDRTDGGLVVNIRADWLLENVRHISGVSTDNREGVFVLDENETFIENRNEDARMREWLQNICLPLLAKGKVAGVAEASWQNHEYLITYDNQSNMDVSILKVQLLNHVYEAATKLRNSILITTVALLIAGIVLGTLVARHIYRPVGNLVRTIAGGNTSKDEIAFLNHYYQEIREKLRESMLAQHRQRDTLHRFWQHRLLSGAEHLPEEAYIEAFAETSGIFQVNRVYRVCVLSMDLQDLPPDDQNILRFALNNIASEVLGELGAVEGIEADAEHVVIILGTDHETADDAKTEVCLERIRETMGLHFQMVCHTWVSETSSRIQEIPGLYQAAVGGANRKDKNLVMSRDLLMIEAAQTLIQKNYTDSNLSLTQIAGMLNVSQRRLSKVFKDETGVSVADAIHEARLTRAAELLSGTSMNVNEVIGQLGIDNETYFYAVFRKRFGMTPKEYALHSKSLQNSILP